MSSDEFLAWYPDDGCQYELIKGGIIERLTTRARKDIGGFLSAALNFSIRASGKPHSIPRNCLIRPRVENSGYMSDVVVVDRDRLPEESLWPTSSVI